MNKSIPMMLVGAASALLFASAVDAGPIAGSIGFDGSYTQNGGILGDLTTATSMAINFANVGIIDASGDFGPLGTVNLLSFMSQVGVNGNLNNNTPASDVLWSVKQGPRTYTFTVTSESQVFTLANLLDLQGRAIVTDDLANTASGTWTLQFGASVLPGGSSGAFTWNNSSATVPDGGATGLLLGGSLTLFGLLRKKLLA